MFHRKHWLPFVFSVADGKDTLMQRNKEKKFKRQSQFNPKRGCYLTEDGKYYCYEVWNPDIKDIVTVRYEVGQDGLTEELTFLLDETDHSHDLNDRYADEARDKVFNEAVANYKGNSNEGATSPWERKELSVPGIEDVLFSKEEQPEDPRLEQIRKFIASRTPAQQDLIYARFGEMIKETEIRDAENAANGTDISLQAINNRLKKIIVGGCKEFEIPVPKKKKVQDE